MPGCRIGGINTEFTKKKKKNKDTLNASYTLLAKDVHGLDHHDVMPFAGSKRDEQETIND